MSNNQHFWKTNTVDWPLLWEGSYRKTYIHNPNAGVGCDSLNLIPNYIKRKIDPLFRNKRPLVWFSLWRQLHSRAERWQRSAQTHTNSTKHPTNVEQFRLFPNTFPSRLWLKVGQFFEFSLMGPGGPQGEELVYRLLAWIHTKQNHADSSWCGLVHFWQESG